MEAFDDNIENIYISLFENRFANVDELKKAFEGSEKVEVLSMRELREKIQNLELGE